jgi:hypothetical protein
MTLLKWTIGYGLGYRYFRCLWWVGGFTALGVVILLFARSSMNWEETIIYSFQKLLPFAKLEKFDSIKLDGLAKWYFYVQQLVGYLLAAFLAAGLAGLTQKSSPTASGRSE